MMSMAGVCAASRQRALPALLFQNGEVGAWYDPSDMSTMFQDAAGTTPVTALGQSVGLMLDKSKGLVLGPELVSNGDFATSDGWALQTEVSISGGSLNFNTTATRTATSIGSSCVSGRWYVIEFDMTHTSGIPRFDAGGGSTNISQTTGHKRYIRQATGTNDFYFTCSSSGGVFSVDNISVRELPGNHAYQTTALSRPTVEARVNLFTKTEQLDDGIWSKTRASISANATLSPSGVLSADKLVESIDAVSTHHVSETTQLASGFSYTFSTYVKAAERQWCWLSCGSTAFGTTLGAYFNVSSGQVGGVSAGVTAKIESAGDGWYRCFITRQATTTGTGAFFVMLALGDGGTNYTGDGASGMYVWGADVREASESKYPYQRVNTATDYADVGAPRYLSCDGTDDGMVTNSIDFTGTDKMTVWAGVRKLSAATYGCLIELSATASSNAGVFALWSPYELEKYRFDSRGNSVGVTTSGTYSAPITNILTGIGAISTDTCVLRVNGAQVATSSADQGTGNYGNYPLYIGRRAGTSLPFNGRLYGLIVRGAASNAAQIAAGEAWMNSKTRAY